MQPVIHIAPLQGRQHVTGWIGDCGSEEARARQCVFCGRVLSPPCAGLGAGLAFKLPTPGRHRAKAVAQRAAGGRAPGGAAGLRDGHGDSLRRCGVGLRQAHAMPASACQSALGWMLERRAAVARRSARSLADRTSGMAPAPPPEHGARAVETRFTAASLIPAGWTSRFPRNRCCPRDIAWWWRSGWSAKCSRVFRGQY